MSTRVGFIGLGLMGRPMAKHLVAAGHQVTVHNRSRAAVDDLVAAGARAAVTPAEAARLAEVVITMLPDTPDVVSVLTGEAGVLSALAPGAIVIDMSSISPEATRDLARRVAGAGGVMLDAPVSGGEIGARDGTLAIMAGGPAEAFERARPIFECMGAPDRILHVGAEPGSGQVCKVCNQVAIGGALAGVAEALAIARRSGVDAATVRRALLGGFAASRVLDVHGERMLQGNYVPGFRAKLYQKDLRLAREAAEALGVAAPATALVAGLADALAESGRADWDYSAVGQITFERSGL
jgi:2-hydroxy-3-oxopropionate reductase